MDAGKIAEKFDLTLDHIGIAVKNIDESIFAFKVIGITPGEREIIEDQGVEALMLPIGETRLELLEPFKDDSPISKFIDKKGEGLHHIALKTSDVKQILSKCSENGIKLIDKEPRIGAGGKKIAFLHPKSTNGVLIELTE